MGSDIFRQMAQQLMGPLSIRLSNIIARGVVKLVNDGKKMQLLQLDLLEDETREDVERVQNYGFTSVPEEGAEAVVLFVGGHRDHGLVLAVDDRRYRLKGLASGEVAVFHKSGSKIVLKENGDIQVTPSSGKLKVTGDIEASGDVKAGTISLKTHMHGAGLLLTGASAGAPVTGTTGTPT